MRAGRGIARERRPHAAVATMMNRRTVMPGLGAVLGIGFERTARAAVPLGPLWAHAPAITVLAVPGDQRLPLVRDGVSFWNRTFAELGSGFRLGPVETGAGNIPPGSMSALS
jgi:hypothetical protein